MYKVTDMIIMNYVSIEMIHTQDLWHSSKAIYFHVAYLS
jgi:hypothetical protein